MKYIFSLIGVVAVSVGFLFFLFNNSSFVPFNTVGEMEWLNISVLLLLFSTIIFSVISLVVFGVVTFFKKKLDRGRRVFLASKIALFFTLGILLVFLLNFFHVLDWIWGLSILLVVLIAIFVI